jgi:hypothetical protein
MPSSHKSNRLPKTFPVGTTYVVEGQGGTHGQLLVSSRYVVLPGGQRIEIAADFGKPSSLSDARQRDLRRRYCRQSGAHSVSW